MDTVSAGSNSERSVNRFTLDSVATGITRLGVPACAEEILLSAERLAEAFWVSRLGPEYLAAMSIGSMTLLALRAIGQGVRVAGQSLLARYVGAGDWRRASFVAGQIVMITSAYSVCLTAIGFFMSPLLMSLFSSDVNVIHEGTLYLRTGFVAFGLIDLNFTLAHLVRGAGESTLALAGITVATVIGMLLMPLLTLGALVLPSMGIIGVVCAVGVGRIAGSIILTTFVTTGRSRLNIVWGDLKPDIEMIRTALRLSWPVSMQSLLERLSRIFILRIISLFGIYPLAAYGVVQRLTQGLQVPSFGLRAALRTFVAQNLGAGIPTRASRSTILSLKALAVIVGSTSFLLFLFANTVADIFGFEGDGADVLVLCLQILSPGILFEACQQLFEGAFQGAARPKLPMLVTATVLWGMRIPTAYLLAIPLAWGAPGVWWAVTGTQIVGAIWLAIWFFVSTMRSAIMPSHSA